MPKNSAKKADQGREDDYQGFHINPLEVLGRVLLGDADSIHDSAALVGS